MNIYRQLAENVYNPKVSSGADIQRMLDMMDRFQSSGPTSNIGYAMPGGNQMQTPQMNQDFRYSGESTPSPALEGQMADRSNPWGEIGYGLFGIPSQAGKAAFPSPTTTVGKGLSKLGSLGISQFTGIPGWATNMGMRQFVNPLMSAIEGLLGYGPPKGGMPNFSFNMANNQFDVDRSITPLSQTATFTGLPDMSDIFGVFSEESMSTPSGQAAALAALGSSATLGSSQAALEGWSSGFGIGGFGGGSSTGFGSGEAGEGMGMW